MNGDKFSTPVNFSSRFSAIPRSNAAKRDTLAAELERDPQLSTAKRQQRTQAFSSHMAHASLERQLVAAQTAKAELEAKLREKDVIIEKLEGDRRWLAERETEEREEKERERQEREEDKRKSDTDIRALRNTLMTLREQHADLQDEQSTLSRTTSQTIASQKSQISTLMRQVSVLEEQAAEFKRVAEERSLAFEDLQAQFDDLNAAQDSFSQNVSEVENWSVVREELHRQANYLRTLETANAKMSSELSVFRERQISVEVVKEQNRDLERKLKGADELRDKLVKVEAELDAARQERLEWASRNTEASTPSKTPVSITQSLSALRLDYARLLEDHGSNKALLRQREVELSNATKRDAEEQVVIGQLQAELRALTDKLGKSEHRAILAEREVGFLQAMVASFTAEEASIEGIKVEEATLTRVEQLETLVNDYKTTVRDLEKEIEDLGGDPTALGVGDRQQELQAKIETEKAAKLAALKALEEAEIESQKQADRVEELEQTLFELGGEIGAGRHLPPGVRVLSLRENPAQQWEDLSRAAIDRLKAENVGLLQRLKELEENGVRGGSQTTAEDLVPRASWEVVNKERDGLKEELKQKEKRLMRLQQVFMAKSAEFREAVSAILGVKLAFYPNGQVRVTSQYDLNAAFVFHPSAGEGGMKVQLIAQGDGGPEDLPQLMRYWIEQEQCVPGFLASITLECYEKDKMQRQQGLK